jgi:hypothetical protein
MLHLLPLRYVIYGLVAVPPIALLLAETLHLVGGKGFADTFGTISKAVGAIDIFLAGVIYWAWRWIPFFTIKVFPDISGTWSGRIRYQDDQGQNKEKIARLRVIQSIEKIQLLLDTNESESKAIVVYPQRDDFDRFKIVYIYENHRKEGQPAGGEVYRGTAFLRIHSPGSKFALYPHQNSIAGTYFTEHNKSGVVEFVRS